MSETRTFVWGNRGKTALNGGINTVVTTVVVSDGSVFPSPLAGEIATLVLRDDISGAFEVMNLTSRSTNTLTVERGAEGTVAAEWPTGTPIKNSLTAAFFDRTESAPPASQFYTSRPYAHEYAEAMNITGGVRSSYMLPTGEEGMDIAGAILSGSFGTIGFVFNTMADEALDISGSILSGAFAVVLVTNTMRDEAMDISGSVISGVFTTILVTNTMRDEAMDISGSIISGTFT